MNKKLLFLLLISLFLFTWHIGSIPILDGDTAFSAKIAKNIIEKGDWITLRFLNPIDLVPKPPLFYWMMAAGMKIFGVNEFGLSIFHSLVGVLTVLLTYLIAKELYDEKTAFWSGLILLTSAQFFYAGRSPLQDMPLTFFIAAAFYCFVLFEKRKKYLFLYLIPVFTALALLTKGPVGLVLVGLVLFVYTIWNKSILSYLHLYFPHLCLCLCLCLVLILPWFVAEYKIIGKPFADIMIGSNFGRFFHPTDSIGNDPTINTASPQYDFYSYFLQLFILFVPWSGFLYPALFSSIRKPENRFIISWPKQQAAYQPIVLPFIIIFTIGMIVFSVFLFRNQLKTAMKTVVCFSLASYIVLIFSLNLFFKEANPIKRFCETINRDNDGVTVLYQAESSSPFAAFYLNDDFVQTRDEKNIQNLMKIVPKVYVISENPTADKIIRDSKVVVRKSNFVLFSNQ